MITTKSWDNDINKLKAREQSIFAPFRSIFNRSLNHSEQYWTFAGNSSKSKTCEAGQMINLGLCRAEQFFGVDKDKDIIERNKTVQPNCNWIVDEEFGMAGALRDFNNLNNLNPAIINIDHHKFIKDASYDFNHIIDVLIGLGKKEMLVIFNFMVYGRGRFTDENEIGFYLKNCSNYKKFLDIFTLFDRYYVYKGTGNKSAKQFSSLIWYKKN